MSTLSKLSACAAVSAGVLFSMCAHATVVVPISTSPFFLPGNASGVIPAGTVASGANTYDFTFTTIAKSYDAVTQMQASSESSGAPLPVSFSLFSGAPGTGALVANSGGTPTAATLLEKLAPGNYYLQFTASSASSELITGGLTLLSSVPEPASWALMLIGVGSLGAAMRSRRQAHAA